MSEIRESLVSSTAEWYKEYYRRKGTLRNSLLQNAEVLFQNIAYTRALISAVRSCGVLPGKTSVLDVGCGDGAALLEFVRLGFLPCELSGVEIQPDRCDIARQRLPTAAIHCGDARQLAFPDQTFDIVTESTMFIQLTDEQTAAEVAQEMIRVTSVNGHIVIADWRYARKRDRHYKAVTVERVRSLFHVGEQTQWVATFRGALAPQVGRFLSKRLPALYFATWSALPFLAAQTVTVLRRCDLQS